VAAVEGRSWGVALSLPAVAGVVLLTGMLLG
jgi:hypothetical protein